MQEQYKDKMCNLQHPLSVSFICIYKNECGVFNRAKICEKYEYSYKLYLRNDGVFQWCNINQLYIINVRYMLQTFHSVSIKWNYSSILWWNME